jgi:hypothetical protein
MINTAPIVSIITIHVRPFFASTSSTDYDIDINKRNFGITSVRLIKTAYAND